MGARLPYQFQIKGEVVFACNLCGQHFSRHELVPQVGLAVSLVYKRCAFRVYGREIVGPLSVFYVNHPFPCEQHAVASVPRRHYAVEHVDPAGNPLQNVCRSPHSHKIAWLLLWQKRVYHFKHLIHLFSRLADRKPPYCVSICIEGGGMFGSHFPQIGIDAPLHYGEIGLAVSVKRFALLKAAIPSLKPFFCEFQRFECIFAVCISRSALIKSHYYVCTYYSLGVYIVFRCKKMFRAVYVRAERTAFVCEFPVLGKREDLESSAVCKDRPLPRNESVQPAGALQNVQSRTQVEMICVAQNYLGFDVLSQISVIYSFNGADSADRHENRGLYGAVVGVEQATPGGRVAVLGNFFENHSFSMLAGKNSKNYFIFAWMKRIRLDIGAFTASSEEGGKFLFFLYKEKMDRCLSVGLTPPQMHSVLTVFKNGEKEQIPLHVTVKNILERYGVELLEIEIVRNEEYGRFYSRLLLFDGEREFKTDADFIDGIIMAKLFGAPIYIDEPLMEQYSVAMENSPKETIQTDAIIRKMEDALSQAVRDEEYERAEVIKRRIEELKKEKDIERN